METFTTIAIVWVVCGVCVLLLENMYLKKNNGEGLWEQYKNDVELTPIVSRIGYYTCFSLIYLFGPFSLIFWLLFRRMIS